MKKYRLLKDLPTFKAGEIFYLSDGGNLFRESDNITAYSWTTLDKFPNILTDWFEEVNESTRWKPEKFQKYYYVGGDSFIYDDTWANGSAIDNGRFEIGNIFRTKEEAERIVEYLKALAVVRGDATSKFTEDESNYYVYYSFEINSLRLGCSWNCIKNGREIYEGDVVKVNDDFDEYGINAGEIYAVYFNAGGFRCKPKYGLSITRGDKGFWIDDGNDYEVIGNIHENPDLLEEKWQ